MEEIFDADRLGLAGVSALSAEEFAASLAEDDDDPPAPSAYPLHTNEGRCGFLEAYIWRGEVALFEAVSHIWSLLNEPKNLRCILIGYAARTGGSGKWALAMFLRRALRHSLDYEGEPPWGQYDDVDELHLAAKAYFAASYSHYELMIQKYADILGGEPGARRPSTSKILPGPWST